MGKQINFHLKNSKLPVLGQKLGNIQALHTLLDRNKRSQGGHTKITAGCNLTTSQHR
jgi:hypothetical protein